MDLLSHFETHAQEELQRTLKRLGPVNPETREALEAMLHGLVRKLSHEPITFLKEAKSETASRTVELMTNTRWADVRAGSTETNLNCHRERSCAAIL